MTKDHILNEIKRTAEANSGVPLGKQRFFQETGIKPNDVGKFWARWGDAISEAGLQPNKLQEPYSEELLLEKCADLIRELGRVPTFSELRLKSHNDPDFPGRIISSRFSKSKLVKKLAEHFKNRSGFADVVALCHQYQPPARSTSGNHTVSNTGNGFVYLVKSGRYFKIGRTNSTGRREYEIGIQLPEKIDIIHTIPTDDPTGIESYWHNRFEAKRKRGEWFQLSPADVSAFKRWKCM